MCVLPHVAELLKEVLTAILIHSHVVLWVLKISTGYFTKRHASLHHFCLTSQVCVTYLISSRPNTIPSHIISNILTLYRKTKCYYIFQSGYFL